MKLGGYTAGMVLGVVCPALLWAQSTHWNGQDTWVNTSPQGQPTQISRPVVQSMPEAVQNDEARPIFSEAWVNPAPVGGRAYVHGILQNPTDQDMVITNISSPLAQRSVVSLYLKNRQGQFTTADALPMPLPAHTQQALAPGRLSVDMAGLIAPLQTGADFPLILTFQNSTTQTYRIPIGQPFVNESME